MAIRYVVKDSVGLIDFVTTDDDYEIDDDHSAYTEAEIRAFDPPGASGRIQGGATFNLTDGYTAPVGAIVLDQDARWKAELHDLYIAYRTQYRTDVWVGLRAHRTTVSDRRQPLDATDKWMTHLIAIGLADHRRRLPAEQRGAGDV